MTMPTPPADPNAGQAPAAPASTPQVPAVPAPTPTAPPVQPAPVPQPPTWTPPPPPPVDDGGIDDISKLPKRWQKEITDLRSESAKNRVTARTETVLRHAYTTAAEHGVNPAALLGSTVFSASAANLDPNSEDFPAKLAETIQGALTANPWMAAQAATPPPPPVPPVSGGDFTGAGGTGQPSTLDQQIEQAEKDRNFTLAIALKRQRSALNKPQ